MDENKPKQPLNYKGMGDKPEPETEKVEIDLDHLPDPGDLGFDDIIVANETTFKDRFQEGKGTFFTALKAGTKKTGAASKKLLSVNKKVWFTSGAALGVIAFGLIIFSVISGNESSNDPAETLGASDGAIVVNATEADFDSLSSNAVQNDEDKVYDTQRKIVAWDEEWNGNRLVVTQQSLPEDLANGDTTLKQLSQSILSAVKIDQLQTDKGTAYIVGQEGTNQTAIFATGTVLVFVGSNSIIENSQWIEYINALN